MSRRAGADAGFTLIELVICVALVGLVAGALTAIMISELRNDTATAARMDESFDVQFATTYWQRDVASIGVRQQTPDQPSANPYALIYRTDQSVFSGASNACDLSAMGGTAAQRTAVVTLAWSEYSFGEVLDAPTDPANPQPDLAPRQPYGVKVTWAVKAGPSGGAPYELWRVRCGHSSPSSMRIGRNLLAPPTLACSPACSSTDPLPRTVGLDIKALAGHDTVPYDVTLTGERRQS